MHMLPATARPNDIVEVTHEGSEYYGMVGKIINRDKGHATIDIFGKGVVFFVESLSMKARVGTSKYKELQESLEEVKLKHLDKDDYNDLVNLAINLKEWGWADDLIKRRDGN